MEGIHLVSTLSHSFRCPPISNVGSIINKASLPFHHRGTQQMVQVLWCHSINNYPRYKHAHIAKQVFISFYLKISEGKVNTLYTKHEGKRILELCIKHFSNQIQYGS